MADIKYPVDLSSLKVSFKEPDYAQGVLATVKELYGDLDKLSQNHSGLTDETQSLVNDLKAQLDALTQAEHLDIQKVQEAIGKVKNIIDAADSVLDIVGTLDALADELNARQSVVRKEVQFTSSSGKVTVDISDLKLKKADDYSVIVSAESILANGDLNPAALRTRKVDEKTIEIVAQDVRQFFEANPLYTDGGVQAKDGTYPKSFTFTLAIMYQRPEISRTIKTVDGKEAKIGE